MNRKKKIGQVERRVICPTVLCSTSILVFSVVAIIYATMMIYIPANLEMKANVTGPFKCTTIKMDFNVSQEKCDWSSCIEWCLNKPPKRCHQVRVDVRRPGIDLELHDCEIEKIETCKNADDLDDFSFRATHCDSHCYRQRLSQLTSNGTILMCNYGICKEYSQEYICRNISTFLGDLQNNDVCNCNAFNGHFYNRVEYFFGDQCPKLDYRLFLSCHQLCEYHQQCFNMSRTVRRGYIGHSYIVRDKVYKVYGPIRSKELPDFRFYQCHDQFCCEIRDMQCDRSCHGAKFNTGQGRTIIFSKETIIVAKCSNNKNWHNSIVTCTEASTKDCSIKASDCVGGKYVEDEAKEHSFLSLRQAFEASRKKVVGSVQYEDLVLYPNVKLLVNLDGCVNRGNCTGFFDKVKRDGRDQSAQYVVSCFYDSFTNCSIVNPTGEHFQSSLIAGAILPPTLLIISALVLYIFSTSVEVDPVTGMLRKKQNLCRFVERPEKWNIFD